MCGLFKKLTTASIAVIILHAIPYWFVMKILASGSDTQPFLYEKWLLQKVIARLSLVEPKNSIVGW